MLSPMSQTCSRYPQILLSWMPHGVADFGEVAHSAILLPKSTQRGPALNQIPLSFLRQLTTDDQLRADLVAEPAATLARHGIYVDSDQIPATVSLPSSDALFKTLRICATEEDGSRQRFWAGWLGGLISDD